MSMKIAQVKDEIIKIVTTLSAQELEALYNHLHADDHIVYVGNNVFEHQDMDD